MRWSASGMRSAALRVGALALVGSVAGCSDGGSGGGGAFGPSTQIGSFNGTFTDSTVVVGGDDATAAVRSISPDGTTFTLDPDVDGASKLKPGSTMLLGGVAVRKVIGVSTTGQGLVVTTGTAKVTDFIKDGGFDFKANVDMSKGATAAFVSTDDCPGRFGLPGSQGERGAQLSACGLPAVSQAAAEAANQAQATESASSSSSSSSHTASATDTGSSSTSTESTSTDTSTTTGTSITGLSSESPVALSPGNAFLAEDVRAAGADGSGSFGPWNWHASFAQQNGGVGMNLTVEGAEGTGKASLTGRAFVSSFGITGQIAIRGCKPAFSVRASGLHGSMDIDWSAAIEHGVFASKRHWHPTVAYYIPIGRVKGIPLSIRIGVGVLLAPALTGRGGGTGHYHADFSGDISFDVSERGVTVHSGLQLHPDAAQASRIFTVGVSGFVSALQFPQVSLVIGTPQSQLPTMAADVVLSGAAIYSGGVNALKQCVKDSIFVSSGASVLSALAGVPQSGPKTTLSKRDATVVNPRGTSCG